MVTGICAPSLRCHGQRALSIVFAATGISFGHFGTGVLGLTAPAGPIPLAPGYGSLR
jgi:hypothetical protein